MDNNSPPKPGRSFKNEGINVSLVDIGSSLKVLEDKFANLRKKTQLSDKMLIETQKNFNKEKKILYEELTQTRLELQELLESYKLMEKELDTSASSRDVEILDKYISYWNPSDFMTREWAEKLIEARLKDKFK